VFDGDAALHAKVDGKDVGPLASALGNNVIELTPGDHAIEIVDANGAVVEKGTVSQVPAECYRAVWSVGHDKRYGYITVSYGSLYDRGGIRALQEREPHVFVMPGIGKRELAHIDEPFPASVSTKYGTSLTQLCRRNTKNEFDCLRNVK